MKKIVIMFAVFLGAGLQAVMAQSLVETLTHLDTEVFANEKIAFQSTMSLIQEINTGKNATVLRNASIDCPEDNNPTFNVTRVELKTFWLPSASSASEVKYAVRIEYVLRCRRS